MALVREANYRFNTSGPEAVGVTLIERVKLLPYHSKKGYTVKPTDSGSIWSIKMEDTYSKVEIHVGLGERIGNYGGNWYIKLD